MYFKHPRLLEYYYSIVGKLPKTNNTVYLNIFTQSIAIKDSMFKSVNFLNKNVITFDLTETENRIKIFCQHAIWIRIQCYSQKCQHCKKKNC